MLTLIRYPSSLLLISALLLGWLSPNIANANESQSDPFKIGYFELIPHIELGPNDILEGPALEYIKLVLKEMGVNHYVMKGFPVQRAFKMLLLGEIDIVLFAAKTPNTIKDHLILTDSDLTFIQPGLVLSKESPDAPPFKMQHLMNKRLAYWSGGYIPDFLKQESIELIPVAGDDVYKRGFKLIHHGRVDGFFHVDSMALEWWLENTDTAKGLKLLKVPHKVSVKSLFSKKSAVVYKERFEKALNKVKKEMTYRDFFFKHKKNNKEPG